MEMSDFETELKLDENFMVLLGMSEDGLKKFQQKPDEHELCKNWLVYLSLKPIRGIHGKRNRNLYLCKLINCMHDGVLGSQFSSMPPKHMPVLPDLPEIAIRDDNTDQQELAEILAEEMAIALNRKPATNCETHFDSKIFDNQKGACAYVAVSLSNKKANCDPEWLEMGTGTKLTTKSSPRLPTISKTRTPIPDEQLQKRKLIQATIKQNIIKTIDDILSKKSVKPEHLERVRRIIPSFFHLCNDKTKTILSKMTPENRERWMMKAIRDKLIKTTSEQVRI